MCIEFMLPFFQCLTMIKLHRTCPGDYMSKYTHLGKIRAPFQKVVHHENWTKNRMSKQTMNCFWPHHLPCVFRSKRKSESSEDFLEFITCPSHFFLFLFQKIGELNEANMALKERIELLQMEKVRLHMKDSCSHKWFWKKTRRISGQR